MDDHDESNRTSGADRSVHPAELLHAARSGATPDQSVTETDEGPALDLTPRTEAVFEHYTHVETGEPLADLDPERQERFPISEADVVETVRPDEADQFPLQKRHAELYHLGNLLSDPEDDEADSEASTGGPLGFARALAALLTRLSL